MKSRLFRCLCVVSAAMLAAMPAISAERLCSVYVESITALQQQIQKAAEVFEAPELGMFPMMMTMMVPGGSQVNVSEPVSLHVFDIGGGNVGSVLELTPATTAEMFLKALTAASGKPLAPAVEGRFTFDGGVAQVVGPRLLLAKNAQELAACAGGAVPALPPMPTVIGAIRVTIAPAAAVPMLEAQKEKLAGLSSAAGAEAAQAKEMLEMMFSIYSRALAQINVLELGVSVQQEGLVIRKRLAAKSGSTVAGILGSMTPIAPEYLSFVNPDSLFSFATGSYVVPEQLKRQIVALYRKMIKSSPMMAGVEDADLTTLLNQSAAMAGAASAFAGRMSAENRLLMHGLIGVPNAAAYLEETVTLMKTPAYQAMMAGSGMRIAEPVKRAYKESPVYSWTFTFDEESMRKTIQAQSPGVTLDEQSFAGMQTVMKVLGSAYEYAAASRGLAFGMGSPAMVEQAVDRLNAPAPASAEAIRIQKMLSPAAAPAVIGRIAIVDIALLAMKMQGAELPPEITAAPAGEGIVFADWIENGDLKSATLIPAADVKTLRMLTKAMSGGADNGGMGMEDETVGTEATETTEDAGTEVEGASVK